MGCEGSGVSFHKHIQKRLRHIRRNDGGHPQPGSSLSGAQNEHAAHSGAKRRQHQSTLTASVPTFVPRAPDPNTGQASSAPFELRRALRGSPFDSTLESDRIQLHSFTMASPIRRGASATPLAGAAGASGVDKRRRFSHFAATRTARDGLAFPIEPGATPYSPSS